MTNERISKRVKLSGVRGIESAVEIVESSGSVDWYPVDCLLRSSLNKVKYTTNFVAYQLLVNSKAQMPIRHVLDNLRRHQLTRDNQRLIAV